MKTQLSSLTFLDNPHTVFVHFFLRPLIDILLMCSVAYQYAQHGFWTIAVASALVSSSLSVMNNFAALFATDRNLGIDRELLARSPYSPYYWGTKALCSLLVACAQALINLLLLFLASKGRAPCAFGLLLLPHFLLAGLALGFAASAAAWNLQNPYFWSNLINNISCVVSGALIAYQSYPPWLKPFASVFPFAHTLEMLWEQRFALSTDGAAAAAWLLIGLLCYGRQVRLVRRSEFYSTL